MVSEMTNPEWTSLLETPEYNQKHLLDAVQGDQAKLDLLIKQLEHCDAHYPGGIKNYLARARKLLGESAAGKNPFEGFSATAPAVEAPEVGSEDFYELEALGLSEIAHCAFVLVAGGLGERLGYPDIKIGLLTNITHEVTYCEYYFQCISYYQKLARKQLNNPDLMLPVAIMTSGDTNARTIELLEKNDYFALTKDQVTIMLQEKVPALIDSDARIGVKPTGEIETKPHGHGDVHTLLHQHTLPATWVKDGYKWVLFFQDTNTLVFRALPSFLGVSSRRNFAMNSLCIPRTPGEAVGAICHLKNEQTNEEYTVNVEYNQLDALLKSAGLAGDVAAEGSTTSPFPGNCNILLFRLADYSAILDETKGAVPEFVNPKYADATKTKFKSATRIECMMQEFARLYKKDQIVGATVLPRWFCFSTVKNCIADAATKLKTGLPGECAFSGEAELYAAAVQCLTLAAQTSGTKVEFGEPTKTTFHNMEYAMGPRLYIDPSWGLSLSCLRDRLKTVKSISMTTRSSLVIKGEVSFQSLKLDGDLKLVAPTGGNAHLNLGDVEVSNEGSEFVEVPIDTEETPLAYRVRGYARVAKNDTATVSV